MEQSLIIAVALLPPRMKKQQKYKWKKTAKKYKLNLTRNVKVLFPKLEHWTVKG